MPVTKNQFYRQEILIHLLSKFNLTKTELLEEINNALERNGMPSIKERTLNYDLVELEKLEAIIHRPGKADDRYYFEEQFVPPGSQFDEEEMNTLKISVEVLRSLPESGISKEVEEVLKSIKSTRHLFDKPTPRLISLEDHTYAEGTKHLDRIIQALYSQSVLKIRYKPFIKPPIECVFHPYYLKEYRKRWFLFGRNQAENRLMIFALDRILFLQVHFDDPFLPNDLFDPESYFAHLVGISNLEGKKPETIRIRVLGNSIPYLESKKIHKSQQVVYRDTTGEIEIELLVVINYELVSTLMGFGADIIILEPESLKQQITESYRKCLSLYQ